MHVPATRAGAQTVGAQGAVRGMSLLFNEPPIAGLSYREDLIERDEERDLIARLEAEELTPFRFQGWLGNRKTESFGWRYDFDDASFSPAQPIPDWLEPVRARAASFADVAPDHFVSLLLPRFAPRRRLGLPSGEPRGRATFCLSAVRTRALGLGAPHHSGRCAALLHHVQDPVGKG